MSLTLRTSTAHGPTRLLDLLWEVTGRVEHPGNLEIIVLSNVSDIIYAGKLDRLMYDMWLYPGERVELVE